MLKSPLIKKNLKDKLNVGWTTMNADSLLKLIIWIANGNPVLKTGNVKHMLTLARPRHNSTVVSPTRVPRPHNMNVFLTKRSVDSVNNLKRDCNM